MIAFDTNVLVAAHRRDSPFHDAARTAVVALINRGQRWAIPWPCIHEFFGVVTHPRVFDPPSTSDQAIAQLEAWFESPTLVVLAEDGAYWPTFRDILRSSRTVGPRVHDARIAALCLRHGVSELWSADRDFGRFPALHVRNPLVS